MKALLLSERYELSLLDLDSPPPAEGEVKVRVLTCGICGTDTHIVKGESRSTLPVVIGHEFGGIVEEVGEHVESVKPGDMVAIDPNINCGECYFCQRGKPNFCINLKAIGVDINGGMAEFCTVPSKQVHKVPPDFNPDLIYLVEPLSCVVHGIDRLRVKPGEKILVIGAGNIGILFTLSLHNIAGELAIFERNVTRLQSALSIGVRQFQESDARPEFDIVIEASGTNEGFLTAMKNVSPGGRILQFGVVPRGVATTLFLNDIYSRSISIIGSYLNPYTFGTAIQLLWSQSDRFSRIHAEYFSLNDYRLAFEATMSGKVVKSVFRME